EGLQNAARRTGPSRRLLEGSRGRRVVRPPDPRSGDRVARRRAVRLLGEIAALEDGALSSVGRRAIFAALVEPLGDAFTPDAAARYDVLFAPLIQHCRRDAGGERLDQTLARFGVRREADLLKRKALVSRPRPFSRGDRERIRKVFVLSRVTVGADVAVTSVV